MARNFCNIFQPEQQLVAVYTSCFPLAGTVARAHILLWSIVKTPWNDATALCSHACMQCTCDTYNYIYVKYINS